MKSVCNTAGYLLYLNCVDQSQEALKEAENSGQLPLDGYPNDPSGIILVEKSLKFIAKHTALESVEREINLLTNIYTRIRQEFEAASDFAVRFTSAVTLYVN